MAKVNVGGQAPDFELPWTGDGDFRLALVGLGYEDTADLHAAPAEARSGSA